jgi:hypothetical protein
MVNYNKVRDNFNHSKVKVKAKVNFNLNKVKAKVNFNLNKVKDKDKFSHNKAKVSSNLKDKANNVEEEPAQLVMSTPFSAHLLLVVHQVPSHRVEELALLWRIIQTKVTAFLQMAIILRIKAMETMDSKAAREVKVLRWH